MADQPQTVTQAIRLAAGQLARISDTARLDAELLMAHALSISRSDLLLRFGDAGVPAAFAPLLARRMGSEPIAYILGHQAFFGRDFAVTNDVLIPRGDSETIVQAALDCCAAPARVLDCGVGSGALLLTVLAERAGAQGVGVDRSPGALSVARKNAASLGLAGRAAMVQRDWHDPAWADGLGLFNLILANPPYVESGAMLDPSVMDFEPAQALFSGPEGLDDYRKLIPALPKLLEKCGIVVLEIGYLQASAVARIAAAYGFTTRLHHDLAGRPRALVLQLGLGKRLDRG